MRNYPLSEVYQALASTENMPESLYADAREAARQTALNNRDYEWLIPFLKEKIEVYKCTPTQAPTFQAYANFDRVGERHLFDSAMYAIRTRISFLSIAALLDLEGALPLLEDVLYEYIHLPTWSLSAHLLDNSREDYWDIPVGPYDEKGRVRGLGRTRKQSLDLCSTSGAFVLAEMAQLLEDKLEPCIVRWARQECYERVLSSFMALSQYPHFEINPNNWSGVCMSSIGAAAIYLITDPRVLAPVIVRVLDGLRVHESGYNNDGMSPEGFGYWEYGFEYMMMFADLLKKRTGGKIDIMEGEKMRRVASFGANCCLDKTLKLPFGDTNCRGIYHESVRRYVVSLGGRAPAKGDAKASMLSVWEHTNLMLREIVWTDKSVCDGSQFPWTAVYPDSECYMAAFNTREDPVCLCAKGGNNGESHNHNDVGSFVITRNDQMIAADTAGGDYGRAYFSDKRYTFFAARSGGHNLPIVDGVEQEGHGRCRASSFRVETNELTDTITMDLSKTLITPKLAAFTRTITGRKADAHIEVCDRFTLNAPAEIRDRVVTISRPCVIGDGAIRIGGEMGLTLSFDAALLRAEIKQTDHRIKDDQYAYTIDLMPKRETSGEIVIRMIWDR